MIGIFGLKDLVAVPFLLIPLPILTVLFYIYMKRYSVLATKYLANTICENLSEANPSTLQVKISISILSRLVGWLLVHWFVGFFLLVSSCLLMCQLVSECV